MVGYPESPSQVFDPLGETTQAEVTGSTPLSRQPHSVVGDRDDHALAVGYQVNAHALRLGVTHYVHQSLLHDAVGRERGAPAEIRGQLVLQREHGDGMAALPLAHQALEALRQAEGIERRGREPRDEAVHRIIEPRGFLADQPSGLAGLGLGALSSEPHPYAPYV